MKTVIISLAVLILLFGFKECEVDRTWDPLSSSFNIDKEIDNFSALVIQNYAFRQQADKLLKDVKARQESGKPISSEQITRLQKKGVERYQELRLAFWEIIGRAMRVGDKDVEIKFSMDQETKYLEKSRKNGVKKDTYIVNPTDKKGRKLIKVAKMSYAAGLILYDNYGQFVSNYFENGKLRRLTRQDSEEEQAQKFLTKVVKSFLSGKNRLRLDEGYYKYKKLTDIENKLRDASPLIKNDEDNDYLDKLIVGSAFYDYRYGGDKPLSQGQKVMEWLGKRIYKRRMGLRDGAVAGVNETLNEVSKIFGNAVGLIEKRKGVMLQYAGGVNALEINQWTKELSKEMKPLDVLFEKTPFRTTDKFIPGHWGHVAIWAGNQKELEELGLWNDDQEGGDYLDNLYARISQSSENDGRDYTGTPLKIAILTGHQIIEALRPGVQINTVHHFMNIDDFSVARMKPEKFRTMFKVTQDLSHLEDITDSEEYEKAIDEEIRIYRANMLKNAFEQLGKEYDFNFNVETAKKIVCSELAYVTFDDSNYFNWGTTETIGRDTISPDEVAVEAISGDDKMFEPVIVFHAGVRIPDEQVVNVFDLLLDTKNEKRYREVNALMVDYGLERKVPIKDYE